jgi:hypothetical protein
MKRETRRLLRLAACAGTLIALSGVAQAVVVNGTGCLIAGAGAQTAPTTVSQFNTACPGLGTYTFTLPSSNISANVAATGVTGTQFITNGGGTVSTGTAVANMAMSNGTAYSTWWHLSFALAGNVAATTVTITHDDGAVVLVNGVAEYTNTAPQSASSHTFTFSGLAGQTVDILYDECCGGPATLIANIPPGVAVPEPTSIVLFGSVMVGVVTALRRRQSKV